MEEFRGVKVTHDYWWENGTYYRQSRENGAVSWWNGNDWWPVLKAAA